MKISTVIITNNKKPLALNACILSAKTISDEVIVVGDTVNLKKYSDVKLIEAKELANIGNISRMRNIGADAATGNYIINCDDDIVFTPMFKKKLYNFLSSNPSIDVFTTKVIGSRGGRYWDRAVHKGNNSWMVDYDAPYDSNLYYSGAFIIRSKEFAAKYKWNEDRNYVFVGKSRETSDCEDVEYSQRIQLDQYKVNIDLDNYVIHWDDRYITYKSPDGFLVCEKENTDYYSNEVYDKKIFREIKAIITAFNKDE